MSSPTAIQVGLLARRSVRRTFRQPASIVPAFAFPLLLLAVNTAGLNSATELPGFPADSYLDFALGFAFMQGALFTTTNAGTDLARDIETGFLSRLTLTPLRGPALLVGHLAGAVSIGLIQAIVYLSVGLALGVRLESGAAGGLVLVLLAVLIAIGFGALGAALALRTGSAEAIQASFPLFFALLFLSSMNMPRDLMDVEWFRTIATYNPVSYLIEGLRSLIITGWDAKALALGFGIAILIAAFGLTASAFSLRKRLARS
jgi:ABC-2 type transport system permease protein